MHSALQRGPADLIGGRWEPLTGQGIRSTNPAQPDQIVWAASPEPDHIDRAVAAAGDALPVWASWPAQRRFAVLTRYQNICKQRAPAMADLITDETGKAHWDSSAEAGALAAKVDITLDDSPDGAMRRVSGYQVALSASRTGRCWYRPHGVMAVISPYNFPAHLANGHIVPALAMGNTIVLKPSEMTPGVGQLLGEFFQEALDAEGAPPGVVNVVQGQADEARTLVTHPGVRGVLFTGSWPVGRKILEANLDDPSRIVALEMGGNNPAVVMPDAHLRQAAIECVRSAFVTTGQRCTCTRRLIVHRAIADRLIPAIVKAASNLVVADPRADHPVFMGPIISSRSRDAVLAFQRSAANSGGEVLLESSAMDSPRGGWFVTPGILSVDRFSRHDGTDAGCDVEVFGPLLRVVVVDSLDEAIDQANATRYGLAASIFTRDQAAIDRFLIEAHAGCVNVNTGTAGASSKLPFGGVGLSGNHRPAGAFSLDYCAFPVAGMIETDDAAGILQGMTFEDRWLD